MKKLIFLLSILSLTTVAQNLPSLPTVSGSSFATGLDGIHAIVRDASGNLFIGGDFSTVNGVTRKGLAKINADGTVQNWSPLNILSDVSINTMAISGNKLFVGGVATSPIGSYGLFTEYDISTPTPTFNTKIWGLSFNQSITKLYAASNGMLYVSRAFNIGHL